MGHGRGVCLTGNPDHMWVKAAVTELVWMRPLEGTPGLCLLASGDVLLSQSRSGLWRPGGVCEC